MIARAMPTTHVSLASIVVSAARKSLWLTRATTIVHHVHEWPATHGLVVVIVAHGIKQRACMNTVTTILLGALSMKATCAFRASIVVYLGGMSVLLLKVTTTVLPAHATLIMCAFLVSIAKPTASAIGLSNMELTTIPNVSGTARSVRTRERLANASVFGSV